MFKFDHFEIANKSTINFFYVQELAGEKIEFKESLHFSDVVINDHKSTFLNKILNGLHIMLGISYWKLSCDQEILMPYKLTNNEASFWNEVYQKGLSEFFYRNRILPSRSPNFLQSEDQVSSSFKAKLGKNGSLVGIGGGKDSIVAVEELKKQKHKITGLIINTNFSDPITQGVAELMNIKYIGVLRKTDSKLSEQKYHFFNGHIPISAIWAWISLLVGYLGEFDTMITANESAANIGSLFWEGMEINHQWSKSESFEKLFNRFTQDSLGCDFKYYSATRNLSEKEIVTKFIEYPQYFNTFSSCNKNFSTKKQGSKKWCGECPKCAFVYLLLSNYLSQDKMISIFGENLLDKTSLIKTYEELLAISGHKPFDCVGTINESRAFMSSICKHPKLKNYFIPGQLCAQC